MRIIIAFTIAFFAIQTVHSQVTDTLGYSEFQLGTPALYESPNGGYAFGNNGYADKAKAQTYSDTVPFVVRGALLQFGSVSYNSADPNSVVRVNLYDNHGFGITQYGQSDSIAPDSVLAFVNVPLSELPTTGELVEILFEQVIVVRAFEKFSIGIELSHLNSQDTVGLISTTDGDAMGSVNAWEYTAGNLWFTVAESSFSWGLDVDLAIFPLVDKQDPAGIYEMRSPQISLLPNPATDFLHFECSDCKVETVEFYDVTGALVLSHTFSDSSTILDVSSLNAGFYTAMVMSSEGVGLQRILKN